ncbi:hypothetical protein [Pseudomonas sp. WS 5410]|uniref:hypothetical protein n=1 Tax=Pseudomonas sp. WS 5410 TaxID=2717485 RepID=UPI0014728D64|nr:hypothetical protein [Pseudomonas sp. WS 5410]NMY20801.1 hypothetical protein [Pseudomonas sp. WS 5410]
MSKHTPGPWRSGKWGASIIASTPIQGGINGSDAVESYGGHLIAESISECNMALIIAAPDLLAALQNLENDDGKIPEHAWALIQSAIAKAIA